MNDHHDDQRPTGPATGRFRRALPVLGVLTVIVGLGVVWRVSHDRSPAPTAGPVARSHRTGGKPNVLVIMVDDQTLEEMRVLDNVDHLLVDQGTTFSNFFVAFPECCPSRATYMSGQFPHNNGVKENIAPEGGYHKFNEAESLSVWLQRAGYWTASVGKYLNEWGEDGNIAPPAGWSHWFGLIDPTTYRYYGYSVSVDGVRQDYGRTPADYQTDVLGAEAVRVIKERATSDQPWFLSWTPLAPHAVSAEGAIGNTPADQGDNSESGAAGSIVDKIRSSLPVPSPDFAGKMRRENIPMTAAFNQQDVSRSPKAVRDKKPIGIKLQTVIREGYQRELEALLSVDKWVKTMVEALAATGQAADTDIIYTSDNGYFHGEHRLAFSKVLLYEESVHLPLVIRGPGFPKGAKVDAMASNTDLAPTILGIAGATSPLPIDGRNLAPVAQHPPPADPRGILLESWADNGHQHQDGIRTAHDVYMVNQDHEEELYDLTADPAEIHNLAGDPAHAGTQAELARRLGVLRTCAGPTCEGADRP